MLSVSSGHLTMIPDLTIVIVNWNVGTLVCQTLRSIYESPSARQSEGKLLLSDWATKILVVDNASDDDSVARIRAAFPQVTLIESPANVGFSAGNNLALRGCGSPYVLLLNPDTEAVGDAVVTMMRYLETHPKVGVVGPQLRYGDGSHQSSRRRFPTLCTAIWESTLLGEWFPYNPWLRRYHMADTSDDEPQRVDWVNGACMLVRGEILTQVGLLDETFFMYSEELDWCRRIKQAGWEIAYLPSAVVVHHEAQSSDQVTALKHIRFNVSKIHYFTKHHGPLAALVLRTYLLCDYAMRWLIEALKYALGHRRPLRRERMQIYATVLQSRLAPTSSTKAAP